MPPPNVCDKCDGTKKKKETSTGKRCDQQNDPTSLQKVGCIQMFYFAGEGGAVREQTDVAVVRGGGACSSR